MNKIITVFITIIFFSCTTHKKNIDNNILKLSNLETFKFDSTYNPISSYFAPSTISFGNYNNNSYDCQSWEKFSGWISTTDTNIICDHDWVYAEKNDINVNSNMVLAVYCPCSCGGYENQARICSICKKHETRIRTYGSKPIMRVSEYKKLIENKKE